VGRVGAEACARLAAEAELLRRRKAEFERLLRRHDRLAAIVAMVDRHKIEYSDLVAAHRARLEAERAA